MRIWVRVRGGRVFFFFFERHFLAKKHKLEKHLNQDNSFLHEITTETHNSSDQVRDSSIKDTGFTEMTETNSQFTSVKQSKHDHSQSSGTVNGYYQ